MILKKEEVKKSGEVEKVIVQSKPQLEKGVNIVEKPGKLPVFQSLISSELGGKNASAVWIDTGNESSTYALTNFGGQELLEKVHVGRAFTPFQHHSIVQQLGGFIREDTELLVLPNISQLYISGQLRAWEAEELFQETWEKILELQEKHGLKVLVSIPDTDSGLNYAVIGDADNRITVEQTGQGWKYESESFDQHAYRENGLLQTTMMYWQKKNFETVKVSPKVV